MGMNWVTQIGIGMLSYHDGRDNGREEEEVPLQEDVDGQRSKEANQVPETYAGYAEKWRSQNDLWK